MKILIAFTSIFWSGMVFVISFIEAPLKFKAPFVTEIIGLGIGQLVFHALNKAEWLMSIIILISLFIYQPSFKILLLIVLPIIILSIQTFVLYPILDFRVNEISYGSFEQKNISASTKIITSKIKTLISYSGNRSDGYRHNTDFKKNNYFVNSSIN